MQREENPGTVGCLCVPGWSCTDRAATLASLLVHTSWPCWGQCTEMNFFWKFLKQTENNGNERQCSAAEEQLSEFPARDRWAVVPLTIASASAVLLGVIQEVAEVLCKAPDVICPVVTCALLSWHLLS